MRGVGGVEGLEGMRSFWRSVSPGDTRGSVQCCGTGTVTFFRSGTGTVIFITYLSGTRTVIKWDQKSFHRHRMKLCI